MKARLENRPTLRPSLAPGSDTARPIRPRDVRRSRRRTAARTVLHRSRGIVPPYMAISPDDGVDDWENRPVALVLDADFDMGDEEFVLGRTRDLATTLRDEEDWFPA